jgi:hypothetical membrane protein
MRQVARPQKDSTRVLTLCGALGAALFVGVFTLESATRPAYDALRNMVSELSLSDDGWMQIANFLMIGTLLLAFSTGLRRSLRGRRGATWGPRILRVTGIGMLMAGVFVCDPGLAYPAGAPAGLPLGTGSWHGQLHALAGFVVFFSLPAAVLVLARAFPGQRSWAVYSVATVMLAFAAFIASNISAMHDIPLAGLFQRVCIIIYLSWVAVLSARASGMQALGAGASGGVAATGAVRSFVSGAHPRG